MYERDTLVDRQTKKKRGKSLENKICILTEWKLHGNRARKSTYLQYVNFNLMNAFECNNAEVMEIFSIL